MVHCILRINGRIQRNLKATGFLIKWGQETVLWPGLFMDYLIIYLSRKSFNLLQQQDLESFLR